MRNSAALPLIWNVPYRRNAFFTGREDVLARLYDSLHIDNVTTLTQAHGISGQGGIGKTQTALEYAYRYQVPPGEKPPPPILYNPELQHCHRNSECRPLRNAPPHRKVIQLPARMR